jgi:hypothetical protein
LTRHLQDSVKQRWGFQCVGNPWQRN